MTDKQLAELKADCMNPGRLSLAGWMAPWVLPLIAEVERLRAEMKAAQPVLDSAVNYYCNLNSDDDACEELLAAVDEYGADFISRRVKAQMPAAS